MTLPVKRSREDGEMNTANYLMLLSKVGQLQAAAAAPAAAYGLGTRSFTCKTCNRKFPSFQALGGHRASHKKPKLTGGDLAVAFKVPSSPPKPKTHECSICGLEFPIGQALGGHMRRHRAALETHNNNNNNNHHHHNHNKQSSNHDVTSTSGTSSSTVSEGDVVHELPLAKKPRLLIFGADFGLAEPEKDVKLELGMAQNNQPVLLDLLV